MALAIFRKFYAKVITSTDRGNCPGLFTNKTGHIMGSKRRIYEVSIVQELLSNHVSRFGHYDKSNESRPVIIVDSCLLTMLAKPKQILQTGYGNRKVARFLYIRKAEMDYLESARYYDAKVVIRMDGNFYTYHGGGVCYLYDVEYLKPYLDEPCREAIR